MALRASFQSLLTVFATGLIGAIVWAKSGCEAWHIVLYCGFFGGTWLGVFLLFLSCFRRHRLYVQEVHCSEKGLRLKSPFLNEEVRWREIAEFFLSGSDEAGYNHYVLVTKSGKKFFLSKFLTEGELLVRTIEERVDQKSIATENVYGMQYGLTDSASLAGIAVLAAATLSFVSNLASGADLLTIGVCAFLIIFSIAFLLMNVTLVSELVRWDNDELVVYTRSKSFRESWNNVHKVLRLGPWHLVKSSNQTFIVFTSKKEPIGVTLNGHIAKLCYRR